MSSQHDIADLMRWDAGLAATDDRHVRLEGDPRFQHAARALAANMLAAGEADKALDGVFKDAGRYVVALWAMYLHVSGGLTLPRLKEICAASGMVSPGRARALLLYLGYLGYVRLLPVKLHGEPARYVPTASFIRAWRGHMRAALGAARIAEPAVGLVLDRLDEPEVMETFARWHGELLLNAASGDDLNSPYIRVFMHRHAGNQIMFTLLSSEDEVFPPRRPIAMSIAAAARRFSVSRIHVRRMFDEAQREGLVRPHGDGAFVLEPQVGIWIRRFYSAQLIQLFVAAAKAVADRPDLFATAPGRKTAQA